MPDTQTGRDLIALAERGDLGGCSFGFVVNAGGDAWNGTACELHSVELREVSIVQAWPAYADTEIHFRSLQPANQLAALHLWLATVGVTKCNYLKCSNATNSARMVQRGMSVRMGHREVPAAN